MTHYDTLGVPPEATADDIKQAWRREAKKHHPDREGGDPEQMALVNRAYEVLSDPERRSRYDATGQDTDRQTVDQQAREVLLQVFSHLLDNEPGGNLISAARRVLAENRRGIEGNRGKVEDRLRRIAKQEGKVRVKRGDNLVDMLLAQRKAAAEQQLGQLDEAISIQTKAEELIDAYECDQPEAHQAQGVSAFFDQAVYAQRGTPW